MKFEDATTIEFDLKKLRRYFIPQLKIQTIKENASSEYKMEIEECHVSHFVQEHDRSPLPVLKEKVKNRICPVFGKTKGLLKVKNLL